MSDLQKMLESLSKKGKGKGKGKIIARFQDWVADQRMMGMLAYPEKGTLREWLSENYPAHVKSCEKLWKKYTSV